MVSYIFNFKTRRVSKGSRNNKNHVQYMTTYLNTPSYYKKTILQLT